jgi:hypothetical protein
MGCVDCHACNDCQNIANAKDVSGITGVALPVPVLDGDRVARALTSVLPAQEYSAAGELEPTPAEAIVGLAGEPGMAFEKKYGAELSALLIARNSGCAVHPLQLFTISPADPGAEPRE